MALTIVTGNLYITKEDEAFISDRDLFFLVVCNKIDLIKKFVN